MEKVRNDFGQKTLIIMSFKTIYENTYTIMAIDTESCKVIFKHMNYQLWESPVSGFLSTYLNDFIVLNKDGMSFVKLGVTETKKEIGNADGIKRIIHSIGSANYLKIEDTNTI